MNSRKEYITSGTQQTIELGERIGRVLRGGEVIGFIGPLGSGKTHLIKGIISGLDACDAEHVTSPTFVLVTEYQCRHGRLAVYHIDAYRVQNVAEFANIGFDELLRPDSVVLLEWADKVPSAIKNIEAIIVRLSHINEHSRRIEFNYVPDYISL